MKQFATLFLDLDRTGKTNTKVDLLRNYFATGSDNDKLWVLALFTGRRPSFKINRAQIKEWAAAEAGIPMWLFEESYHSVGDLGETISLVLPRQEQETDDRSLTDWFYYLSQLTGMADADKRLSVVGAWKRLSPHEIFVFNKLLMGSFRVGVSQTLIIRALSEATGVDASVLAHRLMGQWHPLETTFKNLILDEGENDDASRPYPFYLAYSIENELADLGNADEWFVEWKWDGIRSQIIYRNNELFIWTRGEELSTDRFPELHFLSSVLPSGTVIDGEIVSFEKGRPMPFNILQTRIGRKVLSKKVLQEAPVALIAYDVLEANGVDIRHLSQLERRAQLELIHQHVPVQSVFNLSPLIDVAGWDDLRELHQHARENMAEGFMLKRKVGTYRTGRKKGDWWKWKIDPLSVDAVLIYAQKGSGRRAELFTDYTFAVWGDEGKLVPFAKAYSGLTDVEIGQVDYFIKRNILEKFGPVRTVKPELVFEIGFEGINASTRHKSGIAVRFPRILRWRKDKKAEEADTLVNLRRILEGFK
jgi:DNA ligase 1